ncbi:TagK domain-containing protein [Collimonas antrihumi]|uniref:TagK domain-containing protein n=1 Tax=Collimonas antrihumi TaxID=1940615 RepID=UPI001B8D3ED1|nr:TagK domain-containing protein [Collimonas antrihumi]
MTSHRYNLHLRVLHQHGMTQQATFSFSDDTELGEEQFAEFVPETERAWLAEMRCTVCWRSFGISGGGWWLVRNSERWLCSVNDVPLEYQHSVPLQSGDRIELGMLHLQVVDIDRLSFAQHGAVPAINPDAAYADTFPAALPATNSGADEIAASLTSLIRGKHAPLVPARGADPFDIVPESLVTASAAAMPARTSPPMLSDRDIIDGKHLDPAYIMQTKTNVSNLDASVNSKPDFPPDAYHDEVNQGGGDGIVRRSTGSKILDELGKDYIQAIQDPASLHAQRSMQALPEMTNAPLSTPAEHAVPVALHASIEDMVSGTLKIDDVLPLIGSEVWQLPPSAPDQEVLRLFAKGIAMPAQRANLPSLTRREHHAFSPDSSYSAASASEPAEQQSSKNSRDSATI